MGRRGNGEGSIIKRPNSTYQGQLRYTDEDGHPRRFYASGRTKAEVRDQLREALRRIEDGAPVKDAEITLAAWIEEWISTGLEASSRRRATKDLYQGLLRNHVSPTLGKRTLATLRPAHVDALLLEKRAEGKAASTLRNLYAALRACLDGAVRDGLVKGNPVAKVDRPREERRDAVYLTAEDAGALVRALAVTDVEVHRLVKFMLLTGLRRGEALGMGWSDVDPDAEALRVRQILTRTSEGMALGEPKTAGSRRTVSLSGAARDLLHEQRRAQAEAKLACPAGAWTDSGLVFTTRIGTPWDPRNASPPAPCPAAPSPRAGDPRLTSPTGPWSRMASRWWPGGDGSGRQACGSWPRRPPPDGAATALTMAPGRWRRGCPARPRRCPSP